MRQNQYPLCYDDPNDIEYTVEKNNRYNDDPYPMTHVITMVLSSGSRCQLPFDGTNTDGCKFALIPPASDDRFPIGEYITYGFDKYVW